MESNELTLTQRILVRATELIKIREAWIKRSCFGLNGIDTDHYCSLGAIYKAAAEVTGTALDPQTAYSVQPFYSAALPVVVLVQKQIGEACDNYVTGVVSTYNDAPHRTHQEVEQVFCNAVKEELGGTGTEDVK